MADNKAPETTKAVDPKVMAPSNPRMKMHVVFGELTKTVLEDNTKVAQARKDLREWYEGASDADKKIVAQKLRDMATTFRHFAEAMYQTVIESTSGDL